MAESFKLATPREFGQELMRIFGVTGLVSNIDLFCGAKEGAVIVRIEKELHVEEAQQFLSYMEEYKLAHKV